MKTHENVLELLEAAGAQTDKCVVVCLNTDRENWLEQRRGYVGGSDAGALLGLSPWSSPLGVYCSKLGISETEETEEMRWGTALEPIIRQQLPDEYQRREEEEITVHECPYLFASKEHAVMACTPDGLVELERLGLGLLEIKHTTTRSAQYWEADELPDHVYCQLQHNMSVLNLTWSLVVALIGNRLTYKFVPANAEFQEQMIVAEVKFWADHVVKELPPDPDGLPGEAGLLLKLFPDAEEEPSVAVDDKLLARYLSLKKKTEQSQLLLTEAEQQIKMAMGEAKYGVGDEHSATWSRFAQRRFNTREFRTTHPDLYDYFKTEVRSQRFTVK